MSANQQPQPQPIIVSGSFDDLQSRQIRFLEEASKLGNVTVLLWPDEDVRRFDGWQPRFPLAERLYVLDALRYVTRVLPCGVPGDPCALPDEFLSARTLWVDTEHAANQKRSLFCRNRSLRYHVIPDAMLECLPDPPPLLSKPGRRKVVATGCYDWLHSGHIRFFEELQAYGELYVIVGHDANIRSLKGARHPLLSQAERRYQVGAVKYVHQALISSGIGWLDADPEIRNLKPDIYAVNEDGDKGGKREYCAKLGIEYLVLKRAPAPGLPKRTSTGLRGF